MSTAPVVTQEQPALRYRELAPAAALRHAIACYWQIDGGLGAGQVHRHRVLPDACADILTTWITTPNTRVCSSVR